MKSCAQKDALNSETVESSILQRDNESHLVSDAHDSSNDSLSHLNKRIKMKHFVQSPTTSNDTNCCSISNHLQGSSTHE